MKKEKPLYFKQYNTFFSDLLLLIGVFICPDFYTCECSHANITLFTNTHLKHKHWDDNRLKPQHFKEC